MSDGEIFQKELDSGWRYLVHVEGWNPATCFHYVKTEKDGTHVLSTPKTRRKVLTKNKLLRTNRYK